MENNIKIVRLRNGEDIIGSLANVCNGNMDIIEPMSVAVEEGPHARLIMSHWLPVQLIKKNETITQFLFRELFCFSIKASGGITLGGSNTNASS